MKMILSNHSIGKDKAAILAVLAFLTLIILLPNGFNIPCRDSGIFLYMGKQILKGAVPYRDLWDHKPPLIFFINALGLFIGRGSTWGVFLLEFLSIYIAAVCGFILMKRIFGTRGALFGSIAWLLALILVLERGNLTEEYALALQFLSLLLFFKAEEKEYSSFAYLFIGIMFSTTLLLRQNLIGLWIAIIIYILFSRILTRRWQHFIYDIALICSGFSIIIIIAVSYLILNDSLKYFWDAAFRYNFLYSATTLNKRLEILLISAKILFPFSLIVIASWIAAFFYIIYNKEKVKGFLSLLILLVLWLPIESCLSVWSGRAYKHYFMAILPLIALFSGFYYYLLMIENGPQLIQNSSQSRSCLRNKILMHKNIWIYLFLILMILKSQKVIKKEYREMLKNEDQHRYKVARYICATTSERDYIFLWGAEGLIYFLSDRESPTRFFYQFPLLTPIYQESGIIKEFLNDIVSKKPELIIDTKTNFFPPLDLAEMEKWLKKWTVKKESQYYPPPEDIMGFYRFVYNNYKIEKIICDWTIYRYIN